MSYRMSHREFAPNRPRAVKASPPGIETPPWMSSGEAHRHPKCHPERGSPACHPHAVKASPEGKLSRSDWRGMRILRFLNVSPKHPRAAKAYPEGKLSRTAVVGAYGHSFTAGYAGSARASTEFSRYGSQPAQKRGKNGKIRKNFHKQKCKQFVNNEKFPRKHIEIPKHLWYNYHA